jgi:fructokinase
MKLALRHAQVVKISEEEVDFLGRVPRAPLVVVTRGPRGGTVMEQGKNRFDFPAFRVKAIDSTGAGDAFTAGLLYGMLRGLPLKETIRVAAACGALVTLRRGAIPAMPGLAAVQRLFHHEAIAMTTSSLIEERNLGQRDGAVALWRG